MSLSLKSRPLYRLSRPSSIERKARPGHAHDLSGIPCVLFLSTVPDEDVKEGAYKFNKIKTAGSRR